MGNRGGTYGALHSPTQEKHGWRAMFAFGYLALLVRMKREDDRQTAAVPGEPGNVASQAYE